MRSDDEGIFDGAISSALALGDRISQKEAAAELGCSVRYLQLLHKQGKGPPRIEWAGRVWYSRAALKSYIETRASRGELRGSKVPTRNEGFGLLLTLTNAERKLFTARLATHLDERADLASAIREAAADIQAAREAAL